MTFSATTFLETFQVTAAGRLARWPLALRVLCMAAVLLPMATWLPFNLLQQFRLVSEEEVHTFGVACALAREERRKPPTHPVGRTWSANRQTSCRLGSCLPSSAGRGEFRFLNGTGARLLC